MSETYDTILTIVDALSEAETIEKDRRILKPEIPPCLNRTEQILFEMLNENTGCHILDSGDFYGRNWERNRKKYSTADPRTLPTHKVHIDANGDLFITIDVFHYLRNRLHRSDEAEALEKEFYEFAKSYASWIEAIKDFIDSNNEMKTVFSMNTYNGESMLSQILQYTIVEYKNDYYIFLQIHNGADVRAGYTDPRIFNVEIDYILETSEIDLICECGSETMSVFSDMPENYMLCKENDRSYYVCKICKREVDIIPVDVW